MTYNNEWMYDGYNGDASTLNLIRHRCGFSDDEAAAYVNTSPANFRRWKRQNSANLTALRLLAIRAGVFPWTGWEGWEMHNGYLFPPGYIKGGILPGEIIHMIFLKQQVEELRKRIRELERIPARKADIIRIF